MKGPHLPVSAPTADPRTNPPKDITIFKCPHCRAEYELLMTNISFRQRSYANCQQCWKPMYSWNSSRVPHFTPLKPPST